MYQSGFNNEFATEALPGVLPARGNSPQRVKHGLYAEQFSGSPFTAPRHMQKRSWLYRIRPSVLHEPFAAINPKRAVSRSRLGDHAVALGSDADAGRRARLRRWADHDWW